MTLLDTNDYYKIIDSLKKPSFNTLFARSVAEQNVTGKVYVDSTDNPQTMYIVHPHGMSLLLGKSDNKDFNQVFRDYALNKDHSRTHIEWMQAYPDNWHPVINGLFKDQLISASDNIDKKTVNTIELNTRINFKFNHSKYMELRTKVNLGEYDIKRTTVDIFHKMEGTVVPSHFWNNADDFYRNGAGFSLFCDDTLVSTAYSAFVHDNMLEIGIETKEHFRNRGFAILASMSLIDYCLEKNLEPIWSCRLENTGSCKLAQKLGFEIALKIPYYRLSN